MATSRTLRSAHELKLFSNPWSPRHCAVLLGSLHLNELRIQPFHHQQLRSFNLFSKRTNTIQSSGYSENSSKFKYSVMAAPSTGTPSELTALFQKLEASFPPDLTPSTRWYLLALPCLLHASETAYAANLYLYLTSKLEYQTPDQRRALVRRIRECLLKTVAILGIPKTLDAIIHIGEVERDEDKDLSFSRENWASGPENTKNAADWLNRIYSGNLSGPMAAMAAHKDFQYVAREIVYGFFLSPQTTLDAIDTEITVLSGIMIQNMPRETAWHLRGSRRVGMSQAQLSQIQDCIHEIAAFGGLKLDRVPKAADIEHEVPTTELSEM